MTSNACKAVRLLVLSRALIIGIILRQSTNFYVCKHKMYDFRSFDQVFDFDPGFAYERALVNNITAGRKEMKELFIDKVLKLVDIKRRKLI